MTRHITKIDETANWDTLDWNAVDFRKCRDDVRNLYDAGKIGPYQVKYFLEQIKRYQRWVDEERYRRYATIDFSQVNWNLYDASSFDIPPFTSFDPGDSALLTRLYAGWRVWLDEEEIRRQRAGLPEYQDPKGPCPPYPLPPATEFETISYRDWKRDYDRKLAEQEARERDEHQAKARAQVVRSSVTQATITLPEEP